MTDFEQILQQVELSKKAVNEIKNQNRIFEQSMEQMVKNAPDDHKKEIDEIRLMSIRAINLAKQGKGDDAQQLIKDFQHGRSHKK